MTPLSEAFGKTVRALREAAGYSQERFAAEIRVHRTYMGTLERGEVNPTLEKIARIARGLRLTLTTLFQAVEAGHPGALGAATSDLTLVPSTKSQRRTGTKLPKVAERQRRRKRKRGR